MFESAIEAATTVARAWVPELGDPDGARDCCELCLRRYWQLVPDGALRDLPHPVAHAAIAAVDDLIAEQVDSSLDHLRWATWITLAPEGDHERELEQRLREARGALITTALEELSRAEWRFADLRHRFTDPAIAAHLGTHLENEIPWQWDL